MPESYLVWKVAQQIGMWPDHLEELIANGGRPWWNKIRAFAALEAEAANARKYQDGRTS